MPAHEVHHRLCQALSDLEEAEKTAVIWFAELMRRRLYHELGHVSIHQYAEDALGFSQSKTAQFIRLSQSLDRLPALRDAVASGSVPWTKARVIAPVATPGTEHRWIAEASRSSRRQLQQTVSRVRGYSRARHRRGEEQESLLPAGCSRASAGPAGSATASRIEGSDREGGDEERIDRTVPGGDLSGPVGAAHPDAIEKVEVPVEVRLSFSPLDYARFEALLEAAQKQLARQGVKQARRRSREALVLVALEADVFRTAERLSTGVRTRSAGRRRARPSDTEARCAAPIIHRKSPYRVIIYQCRVCGRAHVPTPRGDRRIDIATLGRILCDAYVIKGGRRARATISPSRRAQVLARDGHRCQAYGCGSTRHVEVHHLVPPEFGGTGNLNNLVTLCDSCHGLLHRRYPRRGAIRPVPEPLGKGKDDGGESAGDGRCEGDGTDGSANGNTLEGGCHAIGTDVSTDGDMFDDRCHATDADGSDGSCEGDGTGACTDGDVRDGSRSPGNGAGHGHCREGCTDASGRERTRSDGWSDGGGHRRRWRHCPGPGEHHSNFTCNSFHSNWVPGYCAPADDQPGPPWPASWAS